MLCTQGTHWREWQAGGHFMSRYILWDTNMTSSKVTAGNVF